MRKTNLKIAIVQEGPVYLDLKKSVEKMTTLISEAVQEQAELVVFGETWLSGYPAWLDHCPNYAGWDFEPTKEVFARMYENSITVPGPETALLCRLAKEHQIVIGIGINEVVESGVGNGTIYNALLLITPDGQIANHHRKLMPTYTEKLLYGIGDGKGLRSVATPFGRLGSLICWEHWMPLTRQALHNAGEHLHIALWPQVHEKLQLASQHYAFEGRCWVVAVGQRMLAADFPTEIDLPPYLADAKDTAVLNGGSCIFAPNGDVVLPAQFGMGGILYHELEDMQKYIYKERMALDTSGHYQRTDVFNFSINFERKS